MRLFYCRTGGTRRGKDPNGIMTKDPMRPGIILSRRLFLLIAFLAACQSSGPSYIAVPSETAALALVPAATEVPQGTEVATIAPVPEFQRETDAAYSLVDRPDDVDGYQIHFIYAVPRDGRDDLLDVNGTIALSAAAMNSWLESKTGHRLRLDTYEGELDISFLPLDADEKTINDLDTRILAYVEHEIKARGFAGDHKLFVVYYDGFFTNSEGYCGLGSYPPQGVGQTAMLLLRGYNPTFDYVCPRQFTKSEDFTGYFEMTILHEVLHLMGMVPECAPHNDEGHVTDSQQDLMYFQYDGSYSPLYTYLDYHNDDYFNHGNPDCADLARSAFLDPLPENAEAPPGWERSSHYFPPNPLDGQ